MRWTRELGEEYCGTFLVAAAKTRLAPFEAEIAALAVATVTAKHVQEDNAMTEAKIRKSLKSFAVDEDFVEASMLQKLT